MNIFRIITDLASNSSILTGTQKEWSPERAQLDAFLRDRLVLEIDLPGKLISCGNALRLIANGPANNPG